MSVSTDCGPTAVEQVRARRERRRQEILAPLAARGVAAPRRQSLAWVGDLQQGDGGKGAMTDRLAPAHQIVVRVQGGDNAGHTTVFRNAEDQRVVLKSHLVPSGLRHPGTIGVIANGVMLNPRTLTDELAELTEHGFDIAQRILVSDRAHLVLPLHQRADVSQEEHRGQQADAIGTTRRGIGPANVSKVNRTGIRVRDLADLRLVEQRLAQNVALFGLPEECVAENLAWLAEYGPAVQQYAIDSVRFLNAAVDAGYSVLFEGAQGPLIDIDHGIYPFVTTSSTGFHSVTGGTGVDAARVQHRIGVLKAYQTMVGNGAFVTEDTQALADSLRSLGDEVGTTTGRPRRCGWLDLAHARWAAELNGYTSIVLTKLDVLDDFETIGVCVGYENAQGKHLEFEPDEEYLRSCTPVYEYLPGWLSPTRKVRSYENLPSRAKEFVDYISAYLDLPVSGVSKGPADDDLIVVPGGEIDGIRTPAARRTEPAPGATVPGPGRGERTGRVLVFCGAGAGNRPDHLKLAAELGQRCADQGIGVVYGAGGVGVMGALSDSVLAFGGDITGVIPESLMAREFGRHDLPDLRVVGTMHERKQLMHELTDAVIALPGGYGTFEELFEAITWSQLGLHRKPVILLDDTGYFDPLVALVDHAREEGFLTEGDRRIVVRATTVDEALRLASGC